MRDDKSFLWVTWSRTLFWCLKWSSRCCAYSSHSFPAYTWFLFSFRVYSKTSSFPAFFFFASLVFLFMSLICLSFQTLFDELPSKDKLQNCGRSNLPVSCTPTPRRFEVDFCAILIRSNSLSLVCRAVMYIKVLAKTSKLSLALCRLELVTYNGEKASLGRSWDNSV